MRRCAPNLLLLLAHGLALPAAAAPDLTGVTLEVQVARTSGELDRLAAVLTVEGTGIERADLRPPRGTAIELRKQGASFVLAEEFDSEQELAAELPAGVWRLTLNEVSEIELELALIPVPSPAISAPLPDQVLPPGPVTVEFAACAVCTGSEDSTEAEIADDAGSVATASLATDADSWTPDEALAEEGAFTATIEHRAIRALAVSAGLDAFTFTTSVFHADSVAFRTGSAAPVGPFCLVIADDEYDPLDPDGECLAPGGRRAALVEPEGSQTLSFRGIEIAYETELQPNGRITGSASADLDGDGSPETTPLRGKLECSRGKVKRRIAFDLRSAVAATKLSVRIQEQGSASQGELAGRRRVKGKLRGAKVKQELPSSLPLGGAPLGWRLDVVLAGERVTTASLTVAGRAAIPLRGRFAFDSAADLGQLDLGSKGGVRVHIDDLRIDLDDAEPVSSGVLRFRILGQRGRVSLVP